MSAETDFRALLAAHAPLTTLVGQRIALGSMEQGAPYPLVIFDARHDPVFNLQGNMVEDQCVFVVQCWAENALDANAVADAVTAAVLTAAPAKGAVVIGRESGFDADFGLDSSTLTIEWWA